MAPLALEQIGEHISRSQEGVFEVDDCLSNATVSAGGSFFVGFSAGFALMVQCKRTLPSRVSSILMFPTVVGLGSALMMHRFQVRKCEEKFRGSSYFKVEPAVETEKITLS